MILSRSAGRLGNQLFQLAFLLTRRRVGERLWVYDFNELTELLDLSALQWRRFPRRNRWSHVFWNRLLFPFLDGLAFLRLIGGIEQEGRVSGLEPWRAAVRDCPGMLPIRRIQKDYYQSEVLINPAELTQYPIRAEHLAAASAFLQRELPSGSTPVAIHFRRGDYLNVAFSQSDSGGSVLDFAYYRRAIECIEQSVSAPFYFVIGDSPDYAEEMLADQPGKVISRQTPCVDFALMSLCRAAILSNSTFAWWAASYQVNPIKILAPAHWLGQVDGPSYPEGICSSRFELLRHPYC